MIGVLLFELIVLIGLVNAQCNPLKGSCPPIPGLDTDTYLIDFTNQTAQPANWILADSAHVQYTQEGAEFAFQKRYDAPYIWSDFYVLFGRIEVVLKAAPGTGIITGAVMMSDNLDEIDWEWSGNNFGSASGKVQTNYFGKGVTGNYDRGTQPSVASPTTQYHTYALDWTPDSLIWSIDGTTIRALKNNGATTGAYQYPQTPSRLHLGLWDGGDPDTNTGVVQWAGGYTDFTQVPFKAYVKSVKITTPNPCKSWQYPVGFSGRWQDVKCTNTDITATTAAVGNLRPSNLPCTYVVISGDYGYLIAGKLGVLFNDLDAANPNVDWDKLILGQSLRVPGANCVSTSTSSSSSLPFVSVSPTTTATVVNPSTSQSNLSATPSTVATYIVVPGDYGYRIAEKVGCTFDDLQSVNPTVDWDKLLIGQILNLPLGSLQSSSSGTITTDSASNAGLAAPSSGTVVSTTGSTPTSASAQSPSCHCLTYTVAAGDYGYKIASSFGITVEQLQAANPGLDWDKFLIGQVLLVPSNPPTTPAGAIIGTTVCVSSSSATAGLIPGSTRTLTLTSAESSSTTATTPPPPPSSSTSSAAAFFSHLSALTSTSLPPPTPISTPTPSSPSPSPSSTTKLICNRDNCLNNMLDARYAPSLRHSFCPSYLSSVESIASSSYSSPTPAIPTPPFLAGGCQGKAEHVRSACACLVGGFGAATATATATSTSTKIRSSSSTIGSTVGVKSSNVVANVGAGPGGWFGLMRAKPSAGGSTGTGNNSTTREGEWSSAWRRLMGM